MILCAFEGFRTLPRDIRVYVLERALGRFAMASCYFAVFPNCIPSGDYIREAVARGRFRDEWLPKYRYQVACGAAEGGCVKIFREARLLSHT
jgi:hypothetical protein